LRVRVDGRVVFNDTELLIDAALGGFGLAMVVEDRVSDLLTSGALVRVLEDWCPPFSGYHLYYPSRRQMTPAFALIVDALRFRGRG